jgi:hypothetical protein
MVEAGYHAAFRLAADIAIAGVEDRPADVGFRRLDHTRSPLLRKHQRLPADVAADLPIGLRDAAGEAGGLAHSTGSKLSAKYFAATSH